MSLPIAAASADPLVYQVSLPNLPIGNEEVVANFKCEARNAWFETWHNLPNNFALQIENGINGNRSTAYGQITVGTGFQKTSNILKSSFATIRTLEDLQKGETVDISCKIRSVFKFRHGNE
jgi:hypothetical protein